MIAHKSTCLIRQFKISPQFERAGSGRFCNSPEAIPISFTEELSWYPCVEITPDSSERAMTPLGPPPHGWVLRLCRLFGFLGLSERNLPRRQPRGRPYPRLQQNWRGFGTLCRPAWSLLERHHQVGRRYIQRRLFYIFLVIKNMVSIISHGVFNLYDNHMYIIN